MTFRGNTGEGGTAGTTVTVANSGGGSGDAFDAVTIGAGAAITFDSTHTYGSMAYKVVGGTSVTALTWNAFGTLGEAWGRMYLYMESLPTGFLGLARLLTGSSQVARITTDNTGDVKLRNAANTTIATSITTLPIGQWVRLEWHCIPLSTNGTIEVKIFTAQDSTTETELLTASNAALANDITGVDYGPVSNIAAGAYWLDNVVLSDAGWVGPSIQTVSPSGIGSAEAFGAGALAPGPVFISPAGIGSAEAFGADHVGASILAGGIASGEAFGLPALMYPQTIAPPSLPADGVGMPTLVYDQSIKPVGIGSGFAAGTAALMRWVLHPPVVREAPMADGPLFSRYKMYRGVSIIQRQDGTWYTARYPAQTEVEAAQRVYMGGRKYALTTDEKDLLIAAGFGDYIEVI